MGCRSLADRPAPPNPNLRIYSTSLGTSPVAWYGAAGHFAQARRGFPRSLEGLPLLLPTSHASLRAGLDQWFERQGIRPRIAGEFEDSALLKTFGAGGMAIFPVAEWVAPLVRATYEVRRIGPCEGVEQRFFAIGTEKKVVHPLVRRLLRDGG